MGVRSQKASGYVIHGRVSWVYESGLSPKSHGEPWKVSDREWGWGIGQHPLVAR